MGFREVLYVTGKCGTIVWIPSYTYSLYKLQVHTNSTQRLDELKHKFSITLMNLEPIKTWPIMFLLSKAQLCFCFVLFFCFYKQVKTETFENATALYLGVRPFITQMSLLPDWILSIPTFPTPMTLPFFHEKMESSALAARDNTGDKKISKLDFNPSSPDKAWLRDPTFC